MQIIPFTPAPDQTFKTTVDGRTVRIRIFWNDNSAAWYFDIEGISFDLKFTGLRLCTNIYTMEGLAVREIGDFVIADLEELEEDPTYDGLGTRWQIVYVTKEELGYDLV